MATMRENISTEENFRKLVNFSWIPAGLLFCVLTAVLGLITMGYKFGKLDENTIVLYCCGAFLEALGEPMFNYFQNNVVLGPQLRAESLAVFGRSFVTLYCVGMLKWGVRGFGVAQLAYGFIHCSTMIISLAYIDVNGSYRMLTEFLPRFNGIYPTNNSYVDSSMFSIAYMSTGTSILKHVLTEADKIVLSLYATSYDQGIFAVANNYGSLVARMVFLPIENASRLAFAKLSSEFVQDVNHFLANPNAYDCVDAKDKDKSQQHGNPSLASATTKTQNEKLTNMSLLLTRLIVCIGVFGMLFPLFGLPYVSLLVNLIFNAKWRSSETVQTLSSFCIYLFILGLNGLIEAFVQSVIPPHAVLRVNMGLIASTLVYLAAAIPLIARQGTRGVVNANICSMLVRICSNSLFVHSYFKRPLSTVMNNPSPSGAILQQQKYIATDSPIDVIGRGVIHGLSSPMAILSLVVISLCQVVMWTSAGYFDKALIVSNGVFPWKQAAVHVVIGAACFVMISLLFIYLVSVQEIMKTVRIIRGKSELKSE